MKGFLGKGKGKAVKFEFQITIHSLGPWPAGSKQIAIGWQRGSKKKGVTSATMPSQNNNFQEYVFEDTSTISVTLYKDGGAPGNAAYGPFHKKVIIFAILETDSSGNVKSSQGSLVLNLADYAKGIENTISKAFNVAVGKAITAAVGEPKLSVTIRSRFKKQQKGPGSVSGSEYSADTTGSAMTANIQSFMPRFIPAQQAAPQAPEPNAAGMTHEQMEELRGFEIPQNSNRALQAKTTQKRNELLSQTAPGRQPQRDIAAPEPASQALRVGAHKGDEVGRGEKERVQKQTTSQTELLRTQVSNQMPESPSKYDSDGFLKDTDDEGGETPPPRDRTSKTRLAPKDLAPQQNESHDRYMQDRNKPSQQQKLKLDNQDYGGRKLAADPPPQIPLPPEIEQQMNKEEDQESEASSAERKNMVQQWLLNQSDSFQTIEPQHSMSDRAKSIKSADTDKNAPAHNRDRPFMERISEKDRGASGDVTNQNQQYGIKQGGHVGTNQQGDKYQRPGPRGMRGSGEREHEWEGQNARTRTPPRDVARYDAYVEQDNHRSPMKHTPKENGRSESQYRRSQPEETANMSLSRAYEHVRESDPQVNHVSTKTGATPPASPFYQKDNQFQKDRMFGASRGEDGEDDDGDGGIGRRRWKKRDNAGSTSIPPSTPDAKPPTAPALAPNRENEDQMSRTGRSDRRSKAEHLLEQTKARYQKYLKEHNLEDTPGLQETPKAQQFQHQQQQQQYQQQQSQQHQHQQQQQFQQDVDNYRDPVGPRSTHHRDHRTPTGTPKRTELHPREVPVKPVKVGGYIQDLAKQAEEEEQMIELRNKVAELEKQLKVEREALASAQNGQKEAEEQLAGARGELLTSATYEYALYMAKVNKGLTGSTRHMHAPSRRLLRTICALEQDKGVDLARQALTMLQGVISNSSDDVASTSFWWSNCVAMRAMVFRLGNDKRNSRSRSNSLTNHWVSSALSQPLLDMELDIFQKLLAYTWWKIIIPVVTNPKENAPDMPDTPRSQASEPEHQSIELWLRALKSVDKLFPRAISGSMGHVGLLKSQVLVACLRRVDSLLFYKILAQGHDLDLDASFLTNAVQRFLDSTFDGRLASVPRLDEEAVMCERGPLTFESGVTLKLAVTRWSEWAFEMDIKENGDEGLFPLLRATADVLMMPKDLLLEQDYRDEICAQLPLPAVCRILERFRPDDLAREPVTQALLTRLNQDASTADIKVPKPNAGYVSPPEARVLSEQDEYNEPGMMMDYQSDDELQELCQGIRTSVKNQRFEVLAELWGEKFSKNASSFY